MTLDLLTPTGKEILFASASDPRAPLTQGWLRLSDRRTDAAKSRPWRPWHSHDQAELVLGEVHIEICPALIVVPVGYRAPRARLRPRTATTQSGALLLE